MIRRVGWFGRLFNREHRDSSVSGPLIPPRGRSGLHGSVSVTESTALRHSAVWACTNLSANLMSSLPVAAFRDVEGLQVEVPRPPVLIEPGGPDWRWKYWMRASQFDLKRVGNAIGVITERNGLGLPHRIDLKPITDCSVIQRRDEPQPRYRIAGKEYTRDQVWHERLYVVPGLPMGLSPIAYAAWSIGEYLSVQQFVTDWFGGGAVPKARLKNLKRMVAPREAALIKERWAASVADGDLFVHGSDWEYSFIQAEAVGAEWLESQRYGLTDICRFFGMPADLIDAAISAPGSITYQSALQRNLQFLIMHFAPDVELREENLSTLLPKPRYVQLSTDRLLRMDPQTLHEVLAQRIDSRTLTPNEARAMVNLPPLTDEDEAEFARLFGAPRSAAEPATRLGGRPAGHAMDGMLMEEVVDDAVRGPTNGRVPSLAAVGGRRNGHRRDDRVPWFGDGGAGAGGYFAGE